MKIPGDIKSYLVLAAASWIGYQLKELPGKIWDYVDRKLRYVTMIEEGNPMYDAFRDWYFKEYPQSFQRVEAQLERSHKNGMTRFDLILEQLNHLSYIQYNGSRVFIEKERVEVERSRGNSAGTKTINRYSLYTFGNSKVIRELINMVHERWSQKHGGKVGLRVVITDNWYDNKDIYMPVYKTLDQVFIDNKDELVNDIQNFLAKKPLYQRIGIKFKRSYLLSGPPGTGKTTLVFAIADWLDRPVYYLNPSGFSDDNTFEDFVTTIEDDSIVLIEDVDIFWTDRDDIKGTTKVSFQSILNVLDGVHSPDNILFFMTTNKPERFDEALIRKGRLDYKIHVDHPSKKMVEEFVGNFYGKKCVIKKYKGNIPMVDIQDLCIKTDDMNLLINKLETL